MKQMISGDRYTNWPQGKKTLLWMYRFFQYVPLQTAQHTNPAKCNIM